MNMSARNGVEVMERARRFQPDLAIVVLTGHATRDSAIAAVKWGAGDYLIKPFSTQRLIQTVYRLVPLWLLRNPLLDPCVRQFGLFVRENVR